MSCIPVAPIATTQLPIGHYFCQNFSPQRKQLEFRTLHIDNKGKNMLQIEMSCVVKAVCVNGVKKFIHNFTLNYFVYLDLL